MRSGSLMPSFVAISLRMLKSDGVGQDARLAAGLRHTSTISAPAAA